MGERISHVGSRTAKSSAAFLAALFLLSPASIPGRRDRAVTFPQARSYPIENLTPGGQTRLRAIIAAGRLDELRWPDFSNYRASAGEFYRLAGYCLAWTVDSHPTPQALAVIRVLEDADAQGLNPADYDGPRWAGRVAALERSKPPAETDLIRFDVALTVSAMRYISDLHFGRVDPRLFHAGFAMGDGKYDLANFLIERIVHAANIRPALDELEPPYPIYHRTITALHEYQELAREYGNPRFPVPKKTVDPGDSYSALPQLAHWLRLLGDLPPGGRIPPPEAIYQGPLVDAVKHFQSRHGLDADGRIGPRTFHELNTPLSRRVLQLRLSLERLRWLPAQFERPPVIVNIPEFRLHVFNAQRQQVLSMKVIVGKAYGHQTPVFASAIRSVIFRPYWDVPLSIQQKELVPDIRKDPAYLEKNNYEVVDRQRRVVSEGEVNESILEGLASGTLFARQRPGPKNSLGLIKFNLPNAYTVYMHGTPATTLFSQSRRDFSHGCIRVEDPVALAAWVLRENPGWTPDKIREAMNGDQTFEVNLAKPIPIFIVYGTAIVAQSGDVRFFSDVYHLDAKLENILASSKPHP